jgi:hypothetical protein
MGIGEATTHMTGTRATARELLSEVLIVCDTFDPCQQAAVIWASCGVLLPENSVQRSLCFSQVPWPSSVSRSLTEQWHSAYRAVAVGILATQSWNCLVALSEG